VSIIHARVVSTEIEEDAIEEDARSDVLDSGSAFGVQKYCFLRERR
jgi:hypothetical protein